MDQHGALAAYLAHLEHGKGRAAGTVDIYNAHLDRLVTYLAERELSLLAATHDHLQAFLGVHLHQLGVAPRSRRPAVAAVRGFYRYAFERGWLTENPARAVSYPRLAARIPEALHRRHVEQLLQACDLTTLQGVRDAAMIAVLVGCGIRVAGLVALNRSDVRSELDERRRECGWLRVREKGDNERLVPLPDDALLLILAYLGHEDLSSINRVLPDGEEVLFVNLRNRNVPAHEAYGEHRRLSTNGVRLALTRLGARAGIERRYLHPHAARHLYGTELAEADVGLHERMALMGHRSAQSSMLYDKMALRRLRRAVERGGPLANIKTPVSPMRELLQRRQ